MNNYEQYEVMASNFADIKPDEARRYEMNKATVTEQVELEQVVQIRKEVAGIQGPNGIFVLRDVLGTGVIRDIGEDGELLVHWVQADFDAWVDSGEVERLDPTARAIAIYEQDGHTKRVFKQCKVISRAGLNHSWAVEFFPHNVVRTVRSDGCAWTFDWYPLYERAYPIHTFQENMRTDDDAEALTVAELAHSGI
jgi:hypothetical protein